MDIRTRAKELTDILCNDLIPKWPHELSFKDIKPTMDEWWACMEQWKQDDRNWLQRQP